MLQSAPSKVAHPRPPACPECGYYDQVVPIVYGLPGPELIEQARRGELALGGSPLGADSPAWYCKGCLHKFDARARHGQCGA